MQEQCHEQAPSPYLVIPVEFAFSHLRDGFPSEDKVHRVQQQKLEVDLHGRVLREDHRKEDDARQTRQDEQEGINPPEVLLLAPFDDAHAYDDDGDECCHHDWGDGFRFCHLCLLRYQVAGAIYHRDIAFLAVVVSGASQVLGCIHIVFSAFCGKVTAQIVRQELPFSLADRLVGEIAQEQVVAETAPSVVSVQLVDFLAIGGLGFLIIKVGVAVTDVGENHLPCTGGAVVEEEVVSVGTVLRLGILLDGMQDVDLLVPGEIDALLAYPSSFCCIFGEEVGHRVDADLVVGESKYEAQDEEVLPETEHAPVDCHVASVHLVLDAQGRVTVVRPYLVAWSAGEERNIYRVIPPAVSKSSTASSPISISSLTVASFSAALILSLPALFLLFSLIFFSLSVTTSTAAAIAL